MPKSSILGPDGQPLDRTTLAEEVAVPTIMGVRATLSDAVASGLSPERLAQILRAAATGSIRDYLTLAEEMEERYLHYASQVQTRRLAIEGVPVSLNVPPGVPGKITDFVRELVEDPEFLEMLGGLTDGIAKGYAVAEVFWEYQRGFLRPVEYRWRDQRFFHFDRRSMTELRLAVDGNFDGEPLAPAKFIRHLPRTKMGIPIRRGFARAAAWAFLIQSFAIKDWAAFCEIYGVPFRVGKYHPSASAEDKRTLLRAVARIANDAAGIIPAGMDIEFHEVNGSRGEAVFGGLAGYLDKQVSKLVVGQTMTSDDGASLGQAKIHNEVRLDIQRADCRQLANTANRDLIQWAVAMNFGPQDVYPTIELPIAEPEDVQALSKAVAELVPIGLKVSQRELRTRLGLSEPAEDDELLTVPAMVTTSPTPTEEAELDAHGRRCGCAACTSWLASLAAGETGTTSAVDDVDALLSEQLADWEAIAAPLVDPIRAAVADAASFEELLARLDAIELDSRPLADKLAIATAIARGIGDVKD